MEFKKKIISANQVPKLIKNNSFLIIGGNGGTGAPEKILVEIEKSFIKKKRPINLTIFHITGLGAVDKLGLNHLNHKGLIKKVIGGNYGLQIPFMKNLIVSNVTAQPSDDPETIKNLLIDQIEKPVRWRESILNMINTGCKKFIEIGPGKVLSGLVKRIDRNVDLIQVNIIDDLKNL